jgi:hypothetical protein
VNRLVLLAAFFAPRRIAQLAGFCGGARRVRQEPHVWLFLAAASVVVTVTVSLLTFLHLTSYKGVPR